MRNLDLSRYIGKRYGELKIIKILNKCGSGRLVLARCDCGIEKQLLLGNIMCGRSKSCGLHKKSLPRYIYCALAKMKDRCYNEKTSTYKNYGGRGINVCERWLQGGSKVLLQDLGERPTNKCSIDRINNDGNYEPSNCRWATQKQQCNNTRISAQPTMANIARECNMSGERIRQLVVLGRLNSFILKMNPRVLFKKSVIVFINDRRHLKNTSIVA